MNSPCTASCGNAVIDALNEKPSSYGPTVRSIVLVFALIAVSGPVNASDSDAKRHNILIITADNLGYGDLRSYNPESEIRTPRLNQLARQGARMTAFYTASPTCTVSRACLLTGRIAQRHGLTEQLPGIDGNYGIGLRSSERLIPRVLKSSGSPYVTGCFGKWNIGFAPGSRPTERGFDEFLGHASGNMDYYHHVYNGRHDLYRGTAPYHAEGKYATDLFADAAIEFIRRHSESDRPWFCYLPFNAPHFPNKKNKQPGQSNRWQAPPWALERYGWTADEADPRRRYAAVVTALDEAIGRVLDALDQAGVAESTFVFFMSDNGAFRLGRDGIDVGRNDPLRSGGVTCWDGGIRVAAFSRWPGKIQPGIVIDQPFWSPDLFVACARIAGVTLDESIRIDGLDPLPLLTEGRPSPHQSLFFQYRSHAALRSGKWKILREQPQQSWALFDLNADPGESKNLAEAYPETVAELENAFKTWQQSF